MTRGEGDAGTRRYDAPQRAYIREIIRCSGEGDVAMPNIRSYRELRVYQNAFEAAMQIFELTKKFPAEEKYSMVDQMRCSSRGVCSNMAEAWRKRRYPAHFVSKLTDCEGEADETRVWLEFALASSSVKVLSMRLISNTISSWASSLKCTVNPKNGQSAHGNSRSVSASLGLPFA